MELKNLIFIIAAWVGGSRSQLHSNIKFEKVQIITKLNYSHIIIPLNLEQQSMKIYQMGGDIAILLKTKLISSSSSNTRFLKNLLGELSTIQNKTTGYREIFDMALEDERRQGRSPIRDLISFGIKIIKSTNPGKYAIDTAEKALNLIKVDNFDNGSQVKSLYSKERSEIHNNLTRITKILDSNEHRMSKLMVLDRMKNLAASIKTLSRNTDLFWKDIIDMEVSGHLVNRLICRRATIKRIHLENGAEGTLNLNDIKNFPASFIERFQEMYIILHIPRVEETSIGHAPLSNSYIYANDNNHLKLARLTLLDKNSYYIQNEDNTSLVARSPRTTCHEIMSNHLICGNLMYREEPCFSRIIDKTQVTGHCGPQNVKQGVTVDLIGNDVLIHATENHFWHKECLDMSTKIIITKGARVIRLPENCVLKADLFSVTITANTKLIITHDINLPITHLETGPDRKSAWWYKYGIVSLTLTVIIICYEIYRVILCIYLKCKLKRQGRNQNPAAN